MYPIDQKTSQAYESLPSYDEYVELIPKITEERDHWKEKYNSLRKKVGEQFVDIIPEVWEEETQLEKEKDDTCIKISELEKEIAEKETPLLKTMVEKERIERELKEVKGQLQDNTEQLGYIRELEDQEARLSEEQSKLRQCLRDLESKSFGKDDLKKKSNAKQESDDDNQDISSVEEKRQERLNDLYEEVENLGADIANEHKQEHQNAAHAMLDEKAEIQKEIVKLENAIEELQLGLSSGAAITSEASSEEQDSEKSSVQNELEKISHEISKLQSSLEASSGSNVLEVSDLFGLIKEKSKIEDELSEANKTLSQLGKREYENLTKERAKQEKVAKKLMELSREKERLENEFQELDVSVKSKEGYLLSYFKSEKEKEKEIPERKTSSIEQTLEQTEYFPEFSSSDEALESSNEEEKQLSPEDIVVTSEALGSLIQKRSSLAVRLEALRKDITAQSLKVEKSLLGVKEEPAGELTASSDSSLDDLSQSQLSLFDDHNMIDELSLATGVVREERVKRKSSRKTPMSKLLKEKAGLEKKHKGLEGKVLVQNAKFKNALREGKETAKAQERFVQCVDERKQVEDELATVLGKIDECKNIGDEFTGKGKLGKRRASSGSLGRRRKSQDKTGGKSLSKNDKRRLLSQRESLVKQLENVKRKVEDLSLDLDGGGFEDLPEMAETGGVGKRVEKLRELIIREAELKQNLEGMVAKNEEQSDEGKLNVGGASYRGVLDVLLKEKERKKDMLAKLERDVESGEELKIAKKDEEVLEKKIKTLKGNIESAIRELGIEKQSLKEELLDTIANEGTASLDKEEVLKKNIAELAKRKEQLEKAFAEVSLQQSLQTEPTKNDQDPEQVFKDYQQFAKLKEKRERLVSALKEIDRKLLTRKEWTRSGEREQRPSEAQDEDDDNNSALFFGEILKRMSDENLNMTDLVCELKLTQEALSSEREITGELLELIKSRVGNQLVEALTVDCLSSPLLETADLDSTGSSEYQEVASQIEHDSVTVAEIITDYKKMNVLAQKKNQKIFNMLELLKSKVDKDLFDAIVNEETAGLEDSKKCEVAKILENNETLFEQIVAKKKDLNEKHEKLVKCLEEENERLQMELEDAKDENEENELRGDELMNLRREVKIITVQLEAEKEEKKELERSSKDLEEREKECASLKETLANLGKENDSICAKHEDVTKKHEETQNELKEMKEEKDRRKTEEKLALLEKENVELVSKLKEADKVKEGMKNELQLNEQIGKENKVIKEKMDKLQKRKEEIVCELNRENEANKEIAEELEDVKEENASMKEKLEELEKENNEIIPSVENLKKANKELEDVKEQNGSIKEKLEELEKENNEIIPSVEKLKKANKELEDVKEENASMKEKLEELEKENNEIIPSVEKLKKVNKELEDVKEENASMKAKLEELKKENNEIIPSVENLKKVNKELEDVKEENASMKAKLEELKKENNEIIPSVENLKKVNKELEDKVEYLHKEKQDLESSRNESSNIENNEERLKQELDELKNEKSHLEDYMEKVLKRNVSGGLKKALEDYNEELKNINEAHESLASECEVLKELKRTVGETLTEKLLGLSKEQGDVLKDTCYVPKCLETISTNQVTLAKVLEDYEKDSDVMGNRLGGKQFGSALDKDKASDDSKTSKQNKAGDKSDDIHDHCDDSFSPKENDGFKGEIDDNGTVEGGEVLQEDDQKEYHDLETLNMKGEYLELLRKVMEHRRDIEEAEGILEEQRKQHEMEKERLVGEKKQLVDRFNEEKNGMLYQIECERNSMEMAMQNLINEIVRLKEERKEIRKNNRTEREKMEMAFEKERVEFYSKNETAKTEMKEKLEKSFLEFSHKEKGMMEVKEKELKEEVLKLTNDRKEMTVRLKEMERELESRLSMEDNSDNFQETREKGEKEERREQIRNEFEEKLKQEKMKFQETLVSLRQEIDGPLQQERNRANLVEFPQNQTHASKMEDIRHTVTDLSIYETMESDFRAKIHSEKLSFENRIKELRREKEELHEQKRELKSSMRNQRLEMCKKFEKEKQELAEKYRNELKSKVRGMVLTTCLSQTSRFFTF